MKGFFKRMALPTTRRREIRLVPRCGACGLLKSCRTPKMPVDGKGEKGILILGESPGFTEDKKGIPFVGKSGRFLSEKLEKHGIDLRRDCWITNANICSPGKKTATKEQIEYCRPFLLRALEKYKPHLIITFGGNAVRSLIGWLWKEDVGEIGRWVGWHIPSQRLNAWICPTWHPSFCLREATANNSLPTLYFEHQLEQALRHRKRPWHPVPDYNREITLIHEADAAANMIRNRFLKSGKPFAFDYETDRLKPDSEAANIVCCSVSDGEVTIAFPWYGAAIIAMKELLASDVPKIGYNIKFEQRWCRRVLRVTPQNWLWDGMLAAHLLDNRSSITGLKFQAFVLLGQESYDDVIKPYLVSKQSGGNNENNVRQADPRLLLQYCAMDSLLEWKVAQKQMKLMGMSSCIEQK